MGRPVVLGGGTPEVLLVLATNVVSTVLRNIGSITRSEKQRKEQSEAVVGRCPIRRAIEEVDQSHGARWDGKRKTGTLVARGSETIYLGEDGRRRKGCRKDRKPHRFRYPAAKWAESMKCDVRFAMFELEQLAIIRSSRSAVLSVPVRQARVILLAACLST